MSAGRNNSADLRFKLGEFFGDFERRRRAESVELSVMSAVGHVDRHTHEDAHFVLVLGGFYVTDAAPDADALGPMTLVYNPPGVTHRDHFDSATGRFACLSVKADTIDHFNEECALPRRPVMLRDPVAASDFFRRALGDAPDLEDFSLNALIDASVKRPTLDRIEPRWLARAIDFIDSRLPGSVSVNEVAREVGVHPVHLARVFKKFTGLSPAHYLQQARLSRAYEMMVRSRTPLVEIAHACGYADQSHLARAFKKATRSSAGAFRRGRPSLA